MLLYLSELREEYVADVDSATPCRVVNSEEQNSSREVCKMERSLVDLDYAVGIVPNLRALFLLHEGGYKFQTNGQNRSMLELSLVSYMSLPHICRGETSQFVKGHKTDKAKILTVMTVDEQ
ncbi:hypothetical protein E4U37_002223 [Claviceps purpurea]|nr:hypothetical protein E4U37_002223 [Claviceps purpurea]